MKLRVCTAALVRRGDEFLFIRQNKKDGAFPVDQLHIPGGGLDIGENPVDGIRREVREETGVEITNIQGVAFDDLVHDHYKGEPYHLIFLQFCADYASGEAVPGDDASEVLWIHKDDLAEAPLNAATRTFLKKLAIL